MKNYKDYTEKINVDLSDADCLQNSKCFPDICCSVGVFAQVAVLTILSKIYTDFTKEVGSVQPLKDEHLAIVKQAMIKTACQDVTVDLFEEFLSSRL